MSEAGGRGTDEQLGLFVLGTEVCKCGFYEFCDLCAPIERPLAPYSGSCPECCAGVTHIHVFEGRVMRVPGINRPPIPTT